MTKIIRIINLPTTVRGITIPDNDGCYNVYINSRLSHEMQKEALIHEIAHVDYGDFDNDLPVSVLEEHIKYNSTKKHSE